MIGTDNLDRDFAQEFFDSFFRQSHNPHKMTSKIQSAQIERMGNDQP
jgi:hypothetical protein